MTSKTPIVPLFVYGTLREGCGLHSRLRPGLLEGTQIIRAVAIDHRLHNGPGFPFMLAEAGARTVGDLVIVKAESEAFEEVTRIELGCGYELRKITVEFDAFDGPSTTVAVAYVYPSEDRSVGAPIPEGDWVQWTERRRAGSLR